MRKKDNTVRYTADELAAMRQRGETRSDWAKAAAITQEEIEAQIAADPDEAGMVIDWDSATIEMPQPKVVLNMRVDRDVLDYFRRTGRGYQARINAVLRSYVERMRHGEWARRPWVNSDAVPGLRLSRRVHRLGPPGTREMPLYPACCRCGRERDDLAAFYADPPLQPGPTAVFSRGRRRL